MKTTNDQIKAWLRSNGKDRDWLAQQLSTTKSVVDSWFSSRGFPSERMEAIARLMEPADETSLIRVPFTDRQLANTIEAANLVKMDMQAYCQKAIATQVEIEMQAKDVITLPADIPETTQGNGTTGHQ